MSTPEIASSPKHGRTASLPVLGPHRVAASPKQEALQPSDAASPAGTPGLPKGESDLSDDARPEIEEFDWAHFESRYSKAMADEDEKEKELDAQFGEMVKARIREMVHRSL